MPPATPFQFLDLQLHLGEKYFNGNQTRSYDKMLIGNFLFWFN